MLLLQTADEENVGLLCAVFSRSLPHLISPDLRTGRWRHHAPGRLALCRLRHLLPPQRAGAVGGTALWNTESVLCNMWLHYMWLPQVALQVGPIISSCFPFLFPLHTISIQIEQNMYSFFFLQTIIKNNTFKTVSISIMCTQRLATIAQKEIVYHFYLNCIWIRITVSAFSWFIKHNCLQYLPTGYWSWKRFILIWHLHHFELITSIHFFSHLFF